MTKAQILIFGEAYELLEWETQYYQYTSKDGFPTRKVLGGDVVVSLESSADKDRFLWEMLRESEDKTWNEVDKMFDFQLHFFENSYDEPPTKILNYRDGIMVGYREIFCAEGETPMFFKIHITAAIHEVGMKTLIRSWQHSYQWEEKTASPPIATTTTPKVFSVAWEWKKQNLTDACYGTKVDIKVLLQNNVGGKLILTIEKKDGSKFDNQVQQITKELVVDDDTVYYSNVAIEQVWEDFKQQPFDELIITASYEGTSKQSPALKLKPTPDLLLHFRPHSAWSGEYGFDWLRVKDTTLKGDIDYRTEITPNNSYVFQNKAFEDLEKEYKLSDLGGRKDANKQALKYYTPWLSIYRKPNSATAPKAKLSLQTTAAYEVDELILEYPKKYFQVAGGQAHPQDASMMQVALASSLRQATTTNTPNKADIEISCINTLEQDKELKVWAINQKHDGTDHRILAGKLKVVANNKAHRYKANIVFVRVGTNLIGINKKPTLTQREQEFTKYFHQALAEATYETIDVDLSNDTAFNQAYATANGTLQNADTYAFQDYLIAALAKQHTKDYSKHYKIFFLNEIQGGLYGKAYGIPSTKRSVIVLQKGLADSTLAHETFHAMGLYHSFDTKSKFTFTYQKTDNIMDYSDIATPMIPVIATWKWQWKIIQSNIDKE